MFRRCYSPFSTHLPATQHPPGNGPRRRRISCRQCAPPRPTGRRIPKASHLTSSALTRRFLGRFRMNPKRCRQFRQLLRHRLMPKRSETNCRTPFQYQLANSMPTMAGRLPHRPFQLPLLRFAKGGGGAPLTGVGKR